MLDEGDLFDEQLLRDGLDLEGLEAVQDVLDRRVVGEGEGVAAAISSTRFRLRNEPYRSPAKKRLATFSPRLSPAAWAPRAPRHMSAS